MNMNSSKHHLIVDATDLNFHLEEKKLDTSDAVLASKEQIRRVQIVFKFRTTTGY